MSQIDKAVEAVAKVINNSNQQVIVVSGALAHEVYNHPEVTGAIDKALNRNVNFEFIIGPNYDKQSTIILDKLGDTIYVAPEWPNHHFVVGDRRHIRYEPRHDEKDGTPASKNMIVLDLPEAAGYLVERFHKMKPHCKPLKQLSG